MRAVRSAGTIRSNLIKILIGALVPMLFLGAWQGMLTYEDSRNLVAQRLRANAWSIAESERDPFIIARHSVQMLAQLDTVRRFQPGCDQLMVDARDGATGIINFLRADRDGNVRCSGLSYAPGQNIAANPWWQQARRGDSFVLSDPWVGEVSKRPIVLLYLPLKDADGRFDGTISAGISLDRLGQTLAVRQRQLEGSIMLVNRRGKVLLSTGAARFAAVPGATAALEGPQPLRSADGKEWTYVTAPMFDRDLLVAYAEPRTNFASAAISRIWLILALPLLAGVLSLAGVWFATQRYLLDWFPRLHRLTQRIGEERPVDERATFAAAPAEIAGIADDLHTMAGTLAVNRAALGRALEAQKGLTRELNHRVRNNIQIIVSLLTMQAERVSQSWVRDLLDQARARVSALGLIHRFLYEQEEERIGTVVLSELLADLCGQIRTASRRTDLGLDCEVEVDCLLSFDRAVPLMLFALEAISDAARRAGTGPALIAVRLVAGDPGCRLEVRDDRQMSPENALDCELLGALAGQILARYGTDRGPEGTCTWLEFLPG